jgi:hypothetical protein
MDLRKLAECSHLDQKNSNFNIFITIVCMDAGIFFRHQAELVLRHQMRVWNYFVKFFYSAGTHVRTGMKATTGPPTEEGHQQHHDSSSSRNSHSRTLATVG